MVEIGSKTVEGDHALCVQMGLSEQPHAALFAEIDGIVAG
jgi:hypothetical protein